MQVLTGILLDVSGSMQWNATGRSSAEGGEWVRSIFQVIDDLIKHDVSGNNRVFAIGFGANGSPSIFDVISTLKNVQDESVDRNQGTYDDILERIYVILENNGAKTVRKWAQPGVIKRAISYPMVSRIFHALQSDPGFVRTFVNDCLPPSCKNWVEDRDPIENPLGFLFGKLASGAQNVYASGVSNVCSATEDDIIEVVEKAKRFLPANPLLLKEVTTSSIADVQTASKIIHGCVGETELTSERTNELLEAVEPYIYGGTPMFEALEKAIQLFDIDKYQNNKKLLFVLSDGQPADHGTVESVVSKLENVTVVSCYISSSGSVQPQRLYNTEHTEWEDGAKFQFRLSSTVPTQQLPRTIFIKRGWTIDTVNNETKLFVQVNHPDHIRDACDLARNVVCCQDALSDILVSVSLDIYINQSNSAFQAQSQRGGTCYANASAAVLHLAMKRILGREGGYPDFETLRQEMIRRHGEHGANTFRVLQDICPKLRLHCRKVDAAGAFEAITAKRPVVARFALTDPEWDAFSNFFSRYPTGILTMKEINIKKRLSNLQLGGHAVVLASFNSECLRLMNSWGNNWADMGFFRIRNADVLGLEFFDVYWTLNDLTRGEKEYHRLHGAEVAANLMRSLVGLQKATYRCPICQESSPVTKFSGDLLNARCPRCCWSFRCDEAGNILALNLYLLSLSQ